MSFAVRLRRLGVGRAPLIAAVAVASVAAFFATAYADSVSWFYPPVGQWASYGTPNGPDGCGGSWSLDVETDTYLSSYSASTISIEDLSLYGGQASDPALNWMDVYVYDTVGDHYDYPLPEVPITTNPGTVEIGEDLNYQGPYNNTPREQTNMFDFATLGSCSGEADGVYSGG